MVEERKKRAVAFEKKISELKKGDMRVKVIGTVIEKDPSNNSVVIDDGESTLRILFDSENFENVPSGKIVRITGIVIPALEGETVELKGELFQDFSKIDPDLYAKYLRLKSSD
jgi:hypothetical protein